MQTLVKRCATVLVLATAVVTVAPVTAMAGKVVERHAERNHHAKVKVKKQHHHRKAVGHRFRKQEVVVVKNWRARGLPQPGRNEVYVVNDNSIYLAAATTLLVKALIN